MVQEKGEVQRQELIRELFERLRHGRRRFMPIAGLKSLTELPANLFHHPSAKRGGGGPD
jgi:hypothetical protein